MMINTYQEPSHCFKTDITASYSYEPVDNSIQFNSTQSSHFCPHHAHVERNSLPLLRREGSVRTLGPAHPHHLPQSTQVLGGAAGAGDPRVHAHGHGSSRSRRRSSSGRALAEIAPVIVTAAGIETANLKSKLDSYFQNSFKRHNEFLAILREKRSEKKLINTDIRIGADVLTLTKSWS